MALRQAARTAPARADGDPRIERTERCFDSIGQAVILAHDPGLSGATAFYFPSVDRLTVDDSPVAAGEFDAATFAARIRQLSPDIAIVEAVASRPGQGVASTFRFGRSYGAALGVLSALGVPTHPVSPRRWKCHFGLDAYKEKARALALRLWPNAPNCSAGKGPW